MSEATIYHVRWADLDRYQSLLFDFDLSRAPIEVTRFEGDRKEDWWKPQPVYIDSQRLERPSFWKLWGPSTIAMDASVVDLLGHHLYPVGELLPLYESRTREEFYALNITPDVDCVDPKAYSLNDLVLYPEFLPHRLPESGLFKIPQLVDTDTFYIECDDDQETFRGEIFRHELTGLRFNPIWTSSGGAAAINLFTA
jgi:hypothetical protein